MNTVIPFSEQFSDETIEALKQHVAHTTIGAAYLRWLSLWDEARALDDKADRALNQLQDKVMASMLASRREDVERDMDSLATRIGSLHSTCLNDVVCKLALWRVSQCPMAENKDADAMVAASAFTDLVVFAARKPKAAARLRA